MDSQQFKSNPEQIKYSKDLATDSYSNLGVDNTFCVFISLDNILYLIYSTENKSIVFYDLTYDKKLNETQNAHNNFITNLMHYHDKVNNRDLLLTISAEDNNIKLWAINNKQWQIIQDFKNINKNGYLYSTCFLCDDNENYILTSNCNLSGSSEYVKLYDLNGNKVRDIIDLKDDTLFIDTYYDKKMEKIFILTGNNGNIKSYNYKENKIYKIYNDNDNNYGHKSIIINYKEGLAKMIESSEEGVIRIWNFHSGDLLNKINIGNGGLYGLCSWNDEFLLVGSEDKTIKLINLNKGTIVKNLAEHSNDVITLKKVIHPKFGECLISQGWVYDQIKLWVSKN